MSRKRRVGVLFAFIAAVLWGVLAVALKMAASFLPGTDIVWLRMTLSFLSLFFYYLFFRPQGLAILKKPPLLLLLAGVFLGINYIGYMEGVHYTTPANAQIFIQSGPLLLAVSGVLFFREKLLRRQVLGFFLAIAGFGLYYYDQALFAERQTYARGIVYVLVAGLAWAIYASLQKKVVISVPAQQSNMVIFLCSAFMFLPFFHPGLYAKLSLFQWGIIVFTYLNTLFSYGSIALALKYLEANKVSSIIILNPLLTFVCMELLYVFSIPWVKPENFTWVSIAGGLMVLGGALLVLLVNPEKTKATLPEKQ